MAKPMKQRLREQKQKDHEAFRQQMIQDVMEQLEEWKATTNRIMAKNHGIMADMVTQVEQSKKQVQEVTRNLSSIESKTLTEVRRFKRGRSWKFYAACYLASLAGSLTAVVICGRYWPFIQSLFG